VSLDIASFPELLRLEQIDDHLYEGKPEHDSGDVARNVVFGGQILAQSIMASHIDRNLAVQDGKEVKTIHAIFARAADFSEPIRYDVEQMHNGRTLGSDTVTLSQKGRTMARLMILWSQDEPDFIDHTAFVGKPDVPWSDDPAGRDEWRAFPGGECKVVGGVDPANPSQPVQAPEVNAWLRQPTDYVMPVNQAILSWATDGFLIGAAMLAHAGVDEAQAHRTVSTGVVSHTLNFHNRFHANEWLLIASQSVWAGRGRTHGRGTVWTEGGRLVATYSQDNLVRAFPDGKDHSAEAQRIM
jgi:acyl-CoA thioesterase II